MAERNIPLKLQSDDDPMQWKTDKKTRERAPSLKKGRAVLELLDMCSSDLDSQVYIYWNLKASLFPPKLVFY